MIEKIREIFASGCLSNDPHKCINDGDCDKYENESFKKLIAEHDGEIRRQTLKEVESAMYHEAFEVNHDKDGMQKWDGGNWIRYKLFEKVMERLEGGAE